MNYRDGAKAATEGLIPLLKAVFPGVFDDLPVQAALSAAAIAGLRRRALLTLQPFASEPADEMRAANLRELLEAGLAALADSAEADPADDS